MRAFVIKELNHPSRISLSRDVLEPKASDNQVLVDVYSAGLNFFDVLPPLLPSCQVSQRLSFQILQSQGKYQHKPPLPFILGTEFAGKISQDSPIPKGCSLKGGQRVFGASLGSFADKVAVDFDCLISLPDNITFDQGAGTLNSHSYVLNFTTLQGCILHGQLVTRLSLEELNLNQVYYFASISAVRKLTRPMQ